MPITPLSLAPTLSSSLEGVSITGASKDKLANAIAIAFVNFLPTIPVTTNHVGVLGGGTGTGGVTIDAASGTAIIAAAFKANQLKGSSSVKLARGIASGLAKEINSNAIVTVAITGTATGTGSGTLSAAKGSTLTRFLNQAFKANGINGVSSSKLAKALGDGVAKWLKSAVITTQDVGSPVFPFSASTGIGNGKVA